ncbi:hypothetical protein TSUD_282440 [Trifolium subterraneum]|uniref:Uncharacterized protein n=1 Tax=Trifolium subterraneum TaxID=3900 RepID=A0A2Z6P1K6_TRISU|nr:hypothetical protein TSUD_282440 [Trifolium subterraneum]
MAVGSSTRGGEFGNSGMLKNGGLKMVEGREIAQKIAQIEKVENGAQRCVTTKKQERDDTEKVERS